MSGKEHANADIFSRLPLPVQPKEVPMPQELICILERIELSPITVKQIKDWTDCDPVLSKVHKFVLEDWPNSTDPEFHPTTPENWSSLSKTAVYFGVVKSLYQNQEDSSC